MDQQSSEMTDVRVRAARARLTDRVAELERRITGAVDDAMSAIQDTAQTVRSTVTDTTQGMHDLYHQVSGEIREAVDMRQHIRDYPWPSVGLATAAGFLTGYLANASAKHQPAVQSQQFLQRTPDSGKRSPSSLLDRLWSVVERELQSLGESAIRTASSSLQQGMQSFVASKTWMPSGEHARTGNGRYHEPVV